jgi:type II secretory pathway pseudopilin PulG
MNILFEIKNLIRNISRRDPQNTVDQKGIGLVETLVAIAILGVTAVTFMTALSAGSNSVNVMQKQATGQELAMTQMETIKAANYDVTGNSYTALDAPAGYQINIETASNIYTDTDIQKITVEVSYDNETVSRLENYKVNR